MYFLLPHLFKSLGMNSFFIGKHRLYALLLFIFVSCYTATAQPFRNLPFATNVKEQAKAVLESMTIDQKLGQLFVVFANGDFLAADSDKLRSLTLAVQEDKIGGLIFSTGNIYDQAILTNKLQALSEIPLLISQDMEYGAAMRVRATTRFTPAMGIAATGNPENAYVSGKITAREAKALGVHQIYAPVVDVNNNPSNPIINVRSFSENPQMVGRFAEAFMNGVLSEGLFPTAKHFPGHGDTDRDSHVELPIISFDYDRLDTLELVPFRKVIQAGIPSVMSAHISFPQLSKDPNVPGTLDPSILRRILLDSLHFDGLVVTDALDMNAISSTYSPGEAAILALEAGVDVLLMSVDTPAALAGLKKALKSGRLSEERINHSVRKLLEWKISLGLFQKSQVAIEELDQNIGIRAHEIESNRISRESVTLLKNTGNILPITPSDYRKVMVISIADDESGTTGRSLLRSIRDYHPNVSWGLYDKRTPNSELENILRKAEQADLVIVGTFVYVRMAQSLNLSRAQLRFIGRLERLNTPKVVIAFGNPYLVKDFNKSDVLLSSWSASPAQVHQTIPGLFGAADIGGQLPISIPGMFDYGHGLKIKKNILREDAPELAGFSFEAFNKVDSVIEKAIEDSVFPGAQLAVIKDGLLVANRAYGYHTYEKTQPVKTTDLYDLASLTKITATTVGIMKLIDEGKLKLNDPIRSFFPEFNEGFKSKITVQHLLEHRSGLPPFKVYVDSLQERTQIINAILNEELIADPGERLIYSDLGFIILGVLIEKISGLKLDRFVSREIYSPAGMNWTMFNPAKKGYISRIPPTEIDSVFRKELVQAVVHDERAYYMDGIAGHAGLFSRAADLAIFAQLLLNEGHYAGRQIFKPETVRRFTIRTKKFPERALGFDLKSLDGFSSAGKLMSDRTFGHLGFTGSSLWIDPENNTAVILLTNRTYPYRDFSEGISRIRAEVADAVMKSLTK